MTAAALTVYDSFAAALERLRAAMPEHFAFEIDQAFFRNLGMGEALQKQGQMRAFVHETGRMGYKCEITYAPGARYLYDLRRTAPADPAPDAPKPIGDGAIDV